MPQKAIRSKIMRSRIFLNSMNRAYPGYRNFRHLAVLLYAVNASNHHDDGISLRGKIFFNFYTLAKIGRIISLKFDRTRDAEIVFEHAESKGEVLKLITNNHEYYALTNKGIRNCIRKLNQVCELVNDPMIEIALQEIARNRGRNRVPPGSIGLFIFPNTDPKVAKLLARIQRVSRNLE